MIEPHVDKKSISPEIFTTSPQFFVRLRLRKSPQVPSTERVFATKLARRVAGGRDILRT
jgi:hypothetical protein